MSEGSMVVNLHPTILSMIEEAKWMRRLGLKVPEKFHVLNMADVKKTHDQLAVSLSLSLSLSAYMAYRTVHCLCQGAICNSQYHKPQLYPLCILLMRVRLSS